MITTLPFYNKILIFLIDCIGIWLAFVVYRHDPRRKLNKVFLGMIVAMFCWVNFAYIARLIGEKDTYLALLSLKIAWVATPILFILLYFLVVYLLGKEKEYKILSRVIFICGVISVLITGFTNLVVEGIKFIDGNLTIIYGKGMLPFLGIVFFFMVATLYILFKQYLKFSPKEKIKLEYLLAGIFIFYLANIIFNIFFPLVLNIVRFYWIGDYSAIVLLGFVAYAIVTHQLFEIKVILTTFLVSLIAILLALDLFAFTDDLIIRILKGGSLLLFIFFGYLLVRSVLKEIRYREEIKKAYRLERLAHQELKRVDDAKTQFILATQHHLRTPLTSIRGYLDLILTGSYGRVGVKIKEAISKLQVSTNRLIRIVNELLDVSQFQLGKEVVSLQSGVSLDPIFKEIGEELKFEAQTKGVYLKIQKPKTLPKIKADPEKLKIALYNFVDNGLKYTHQGGVSVKVAPTDHMVKITIKDTGMGISKEELKDLFDRVFERGKEAQKTHGTGRGIGLFIASHIIQAHRGKVWAESKGKGKGSTFYIELPIG